MWIPSGWKIVTSAGANFAVSTRVSILQLGGSIGAIYVASTKGGTVHTLTFEALGAGIGGGFPVSIAGSTPEFPGSGIGVIMARVGGDHATTAPRPRHGEVAKLRIRDLLGLCQIAVVDLSPTPQGLSGAVIHFNLDSLLGDPMAADDHCRARGIYWGTSVGIQGGADANVYRGNLSLSWTVEVLI